LKVAIAGAGRGIGAACARELARQGHALVLCARTASELHGVAAETGARAVVADLSTDAGAEAFAREAGAVELAIVCAGAPHAPVLLAEARRDLLAEALLQNAVAPTLAAAALLRHGARSVLLLSSIITQKPPLAGAAPYTAAKAALESFVRAFSEEHWPRARVNALCLQPVRTRMHDSIGTPPEVQRHFLGVEGAARLVLQAAEQPGTGRILDAEGPLADVEPFDEPLVEAEPGRRASPRVRTALRASADAVHRYPRGAGELAARIAALHQVPPECVALSGGGATGLLERALRVFCGRNDEVVSPFPTFEVLSALCSRAGVRHRPVPSPRTPDGLFGPLAAAPLVNAIGPRTRLLYVATPDNPTGAILPEAGRDELLRTRVPLLLDEAWSAEPPAKPAALHLRSFSKLHGLAALRVAYAVGPEEQIALLRKLELPFPLGAPQIAAAHAALDQPQRMQRAARLSQRERDHVANAFRDLGLAVSQGSAPVLLLRAETANAAGRLLFALQAAGAAVQQAHWDPQTLALGLARKPTNRRALAAARRALER